MAHDVPPSKASLRPARSKLDPRLSVLLEMNAERRAALATHERSSMQALAAQFREAFHALAYATERDQPQQLQRLNALNRDVFAPLTTGLQEPPGDPASARISGFIVAECSASELERLGVTVRCQAGDVFTVSIPIDAISRVEEFPAVKYVELARPVFPTVDVAVRNGQIDVLRASNADGTGTLVGILDSTLDIYHGGFRNPADDTTRVRYLWDQTLVPGAGESGPSPFATGSTPSYGVEYDKADIDAQLAAFTGANAYSLVRHNTAGEVGGHGTAVAGIAVGNGRESPAGKLYQGAAPGAEIIFVAQPDLYTSGVLADITQVADGFAYVFERAAQLNRPCVANLSHGDNLGPHDGTSPGELFLDHLLEQPGRAIVVSAGNSTGAKSHAAGRVVAGTPKVISLTCAASANKSDGLQIWYDGHDRFDVVVTVPGIGTTGSVSPGNDATISGNGVTVTVSSRLDFPTNHDNYISIIFALDPGASIPAVTTTIALHATTAINGAFHAWVDRNNRPKLQFGSDVDDTSLTLGTPGTARRVITVGNHNKAMPPVIAPSSGLGPTRDGRIKPEIAATGTDIAAADLWTTRSRNRNGPVANNYAKFSGTSASAPLVAGACACLFQCRGPGTSWAQLKQILEDTAGTTGLTVPSNAFGFGYLQIGTGCSTATPTVDVWLRDAPADTGQEPFTGPIAWLSPDIEVLDMGRQPAANPTYANGAVNNIIRVTVRNRGNQGARNTEVHCYWADPATNIPYPGAWRGSGIYRETPHGFVDQTNTAVIPLIDAGQSKQVEFGWAPPAPGSNLRGDDHFCLIVRVENALDPSRVGAGGWPVIATRNNVALRNLHVVALAQRVMSAFYVVGTGEVDALGVLPDLAGGEVRLRLPSRVLRWRDGMPNPVAPSNHPALVGPRITAITGIVNAARLSIENGVAEVTLDGTGPLLVPELRLKHLERAPASIVVIGGQVERAHCRIHVGQRSGGRLVGGVSVELR